MEPGAGNQLIFPNNQKKMETGTTDYDSDTSVETVDTVEAGSCVTTLESSDSDTSVDTVDTVEAGSCVTTLESSGSEDGVQCVACYRCFPRALWYEWPVVEGRERECYACCRR